jgi:hypothetical protein
LEIFKSSNSIGNKELYFQPIEEDSIIFDNSSGQPSPARPGAQSNLASGRTAAGGPIIEKASGLIRDDVNFDHGRVGFSLWGCLLGRGAYSGIMF